MEMKYFIFGIESQIYLTSNLALVQYLINNSLTIKELYEKCDKYIKKVHFINDLSPSDIYKHDSPEKFPFYNEKYF